MSGENGRANSHYVRFGHALARFSGLCCLTSFFFTLSVGIERIQQDKITQSMFYLVPGSITLLAGLWLVFLNNNGSVKYVSLATLLLLAAFASVSTWPSAAFSGLYFVAAASIVYIRIGLKLIVSSRDASQTVREVAMKQPKVLTSFSSVEKKVSSDMSKAVSAQLIDAIPYGFIVIANIVAFSLKWEKFSTISPALALARASAATINLNLGVLALPTLHRLWSLLFRVLSPSRRPKHTKNKQLHRSIALAAVVGCYFHILGHVAFIATRRGEIYLMTAWLTGIMLAPIFFSLYFWSTSKPPRKRFDQAHLWGVLTGTALLFTHGDSAMLWCAPGVALTIIERILASRPTSTKVTLDVVEKYGKSILHLKFSGPLKLVGGEYVYINIPTISANEWRPFSVIPNIDSKGFSLFIRVRSEELSWTNRLQRCVTTILSNKDNVIVDGPHASPTCHFVNYKRIILAATGVGCTPVISVLRAIRIARKAPAHITVAWIIPHRELAEFKWMLKEICDMCQWVTAGRPNISFRAHIYVTGCVPCSQDRERGLTSSAIWSSMDSLFVAASNPDAPAILQSANKKPRPWMMVEVWRGRPVFSSLLLTEKHDAVAQGYEGNLGVFCCGPPIFVRDVRNAVRFASKRSLGDAIMDPSAREDDNETADTEPEIENDPGQTVNFAFHREVF